MAYRVSLSDMLAADQVLGGRSKGRRPKLAGILKVASAPVGVRVRKSSRVRRVCESTTKSRLQTWLLQERWVGAIQVNRGNNVKTRSRLTLEHSRRVSDLSGR
jgi:hypothetical protein